MIYIYLFSDLIKRRYDLPQLRSCEDRRCEFALAPVLFTLGGDQSRPKYDLIGSENGAASVQIRYEYKAGALKKY